MSYDEKLAYLEFWGYEAGSPEAEQAWAEKCEMMAKKRELHHQVMGDIHPYVSQIDGSVINSRSSHRKHLKDHGCIEVGNETNHLKPKPMTAPGGMKESLIDAAYKLKIFKA